MLKSRRLLFLLLSPLFAFTGPAPVCAQTQAQPPRELSNYVARVEAQIQSNWVQNRSITPAAQTPRVRFTVMSDGHIENAHLSKSSTDESVDAAALSCVNKSAPFAPLPAGSPKDGIDLDIGLNVSLVKPSDTKESEASTQARKEANQLMQTGDWQGAIKCLETFVEKHPDDRLTRNKLVDMYINQATLSKESDPKTAEAMAEKAKQADPENP
ncbi:MAG TPA: TonB family protein, partial [Chroococcales cyanobacterium]